MQSKVQGATPNRRDADTFSQSRREYVLPIHAELCHTAGRREADGGFGICPVAGRADRDAAGCLNRGGNLDRSGAGRKIHDGNSVGEAGFYPSGGHQLTVDIALQGDGVPGVAGHSIGNVCGQSPQVAVRSGDHQGRG